MTYRDISIMPGETTQEFIDRTVASAPPITPEAAAKISRLLGGSGYTSPPVTGGVYVIEFSTGVIKVGMSTDMHTRLRSHERHAQSIGVSMVRHWSVDGLADFKDFERDLISSCLLTGKRNGSSNEYFSGVSFEAAVDFAREITGRDGVSKQIFSDLQKAARELAKQFPPINNEQREIIGQLLRTSDNYPGDDES